jgi:hypothetical protein
MAREVRDSRAMILHVSSSRQLIRLSCRGDFFLYFFQRMLEKKVPQDIAKLRQSWYNSGPVPL